MDIIKQIVANLECEKKKNSSLLLLYDRCPHIKYDIGPILKIILENEHTRSKLSKICDSGISKQVSLMANLI